MTSTVETRSTALWDAAHRVEALFSPVRVTPNPLFASRSKTPEVARDFFLGCIVQIFFASFQDYFSNHVNYLLGSLSITTSAPTPDLGAAGGPSSGISSLLQSLPESTSYVGMPHILSNFCSIPFGSIYFWVYANAKIHLDSGTPHPGPRTLPNASTQSVPLIRHSHF
ncbi:hypothetical protein C8F04DRAFT_346313 [Mycena alexandri]|uniref:Uncharacterized protein n=1 Tax=Mycena alexandri TaxID=1745969 RepID=A0AAD6XIQ2_9AGAR|nr:hypothetical protein C8F04DRAFT_346313 [Mycena alexandri]